MTNASRLIAFLLTFSPATYAQTVSPLNPQTLNLAEGASCSMEEMEDEELSKAATQLETKYNAERTKWQKKAANSKDPYEIEAALRFFAPSIFPNQYYQPLTWNENFVSEFDRVSNFSAVDDENEKAVKSNNAAINPDKVKFISGTFTAKDGSTVTPTKEQQAALDAYKNELLDILIANKDCDTFKFDLVSSKYSEKYFDDEEKAKAYLSDTDLHASKLERCEGLLERKKTKIIATPISNTEKELECPGLESFFLDNQWELEPSQVMDANQKFYTPYTCSEITPCEANNGKILEMKGRLKKDADEKYAAAQKVIDACVAQLKDKDILGVDIDSSASRYKNTGIACKLSFAELSQKRAESARDLLLQSFDRNKIEYKSPLKANGNPYLFNFDIDSGGQWGAYVDAVTKEGSKPDPKFMKLVGSSGPAPGLSDKENYDQYKYVKVKIRYRDKVKEVPKEDESKKYQVICRQIGYSCSYGSSGGTYRVKTPKYRHSKGKKKFSKGPKVKKDKSDNAKCFF